MNNFELKTKELAQKAADSFVIVDIRDKNAYSYGHIPGSINIPAEQLAEIDLPKAKDIVLYCRTGNVSHSAVKQLREKGYNAFELTGGYYAWLSEHINDLDADSANRIEEGLRKKYARKLFTPFAKAIVQYNMLQPNDKVAVCMSGGKDSMLMAKLFQELKRHNKFPFELVFLVMDPGYSPENREIIERNARLLNIPITVFETDIFENVFEIDKSPCYVCARMRRGHLYNKAKELGCNKIALGHHYDDVIETILMGMLYGAQVQTMMPKLKSTNFEGMELIRPMYLVREKDIIAWRNDNNLQFIQCACKFTDTCTSCGNSDSKRQKVKELIRTLKQDDPQIEQNIFKSVENVNLATVIAYKDKNGVKHTFTDDYD